MEEIEVPPYFLCPISLEIMKDPVTISTGITYDRHSIETWLFSSKNKTCPVTKQPVSADSEDLITPNLTLRRLIQSWCNLNASRGVEQIPTPKPPISRPYVQKLLSDARSPDLQTKCLQRLRSIASSQNGSSKRCVESAGSVEFLTSVVNSECSTSSSSSKEAGDAFDTRVLTDDALCILYNIQLTESGLRQLIRGGQFVDSLIQVMLRGSYDSRAFAILLLKSMFEVAEPMEMITLRPDFFHKIVQVLHDGISPQETKTALKLLIHVCPWGRSRIKAVEAGAVRVLVEMLLESSERRICELVFMLLEMVCQCAEGRAELLRHGAGIAIVSKKILRVSHTASERAVRILHLLVRFSTTAAVVREMLEIGVPAKLCLVLQVESRKKTKEKATEILRLHGRAWRNSHCIPANLALCYPLGESLVATSAND